MQYDPHPIAEAFPEMSGHEYASLVDSVRATGLIHEIVLYEGKILDGRHRYRACNEAGVPARFKQFNGTDASAAVAYVRGENLARRNLTPGQISMCASRCHEIVAAEAKKREHARKTRDSAHVGGVLEKGETAEILGKQFGVGRNTVKRAMDVRKKGVPELVALVEKGDITVTEAARIAKLGADAQHKILLATSESARRKSTTKAINYSSARKRKEAHVPQNLPGTEYTRAVLGRIELITNDLATRGLGKSKTREAMRKFVSEFNVADPLQRARAEHCMVGLEFLHCLYSELAHQLAAESNVVAIR